MSRGFTCLRLALAIALSGVIAACAADEESPPQASTAERGWVSTDHRPPMRGAYHKQSDRFSNIALQTQHGEQVFFYDDLIKDKAVIINFVYTTCTKTCPATSAQLAKLNDSFGPWIGKDITMLSITLDPEVDDPARLKHYWELLGSKPGWLFLTGDYDDIDRLRHELGVYDLDPVIDADRTQHAGIVTFGNDRTDSWAALPVFMHRQQLAKTVLQITRDDQWQTSARRVVQAPLRSDVYPGRGVVRGVFADRDEVLIEHGDIPGLMMAMTMPFKVADPGMLHALGVGDAVEFQVQLADRGHQIASIRVLADSQSEASEDR